MTVREAIKNIRKYRGYRIITRNGTEIVLLDLHASEWDSIGKIKVINGERIHRTIFCEIKPSKRTCHMEVIEKYTMYFPNENGYSYFRDGEYDVPERDMNLFISLNGGIDEYLTVSVPMTMMYDSLYIFSKEYLCDDVGF